MLAGVSTQPVYVLGRYGDSVRDGDEYYFYFWAGTPKGGRPCPLGTLNYGIAGHLAC